MISILLHDQGLRFVAVEGQGFEIYDHPLDDRRVWNEDWISEAFEKGREELHFSAKDDFRLLVDQPWAHNIAQSVPFGERQLPQVLENYLEEELAEDIESFRFDYRVLHAQPQHCAVLGFWIHGQVLSSWCAFADEMALNAFDVQPAELALIPESPDARELTLVKDLSGRVRFSAFTMEKGLPQLTLGSLVGNLEMDRLVQALRFQGGKWSSMAAIKLDKQLEDFKGLGEVMEISEVREFSPSIQDDPFSSWQLEDRSLRLHYRKGDLAQKGIEERLLVPCAVLTFFLCFYLGVMAWSRYELASRDEIQRRVYQQKRSSIWKGLFPAERVPSSRMVEMMRAKRKEMIGDPEDSRQDGEDMSSLQVFGKLFTFIEPEDAVFIERANIGKSIQISGTSTDQPSVYRLGEGFGSNSGFRQPNINAIQREESFQFKFSTAYVGEEGQK